MISLITVLCFDIEYYLFCLLHSLLELRIAIVSDARESKYIAQ